MHADHAAVNLNFWVTPDEANLDPLSGGLVVYPKAPPVVKVELPGGSSREEVRTLARDASSIVAPAERQPFGKVPGHVSYDLRRGPWMHVRTKYSSCDCLLWLSPSDLDLLSSARTSYHFRNNA